MGEEEFEEYLDTDPDVHLARFLEEMAEQTNIVHLKLIDEKIMWLYHPDLLASAVVQVEQVDILCMMSRVHISAVLRKLDSNSRLKRLNLGNNDVSEVPEHLL